MLASHFEAYIISCHLPDRLLQAYAERGKRFHDRGTTAERKGLITLVA